MGVSWPPKGTFKPAPLVPNPDGGRPPVNLILVNLILALIAALPILAWLFWRLL